MKRAAVIFLAMAILPHGLCGTAVAGHPLGTEDAGVQGKGNAEVEINYERSHAAGGARDTSLGNTYTLGVMEKMDLGVSFSYLFSRPAGDTPSARGMGDTEVSLKTSFHDGGGWVPTVGIKAGVVLPTADHEKGLGPGRPAATLTTIADWETGPFLVHLNIRGILPGRPIGETDRDDFIVVGMAAEWELRGGTAVVGEYSWEKNVGAGGSAASEILGGLVEKVSKNVAISAAVRWGTTEASSNVTYLAGVTIGIGGK